MLPQLPSADSRASLAAVAIGRTCEKCDGKWYVDRFQGTVSVDVAFWPKLIPLSQPQPHLRFVRQAGRTGEDLRRVQLWHIRWAVYRLRWAR